MRTLLSYVSSYLKEDYRFSYYLLVLIFISICLFLNYYFRLEKDFLDPLYGSPYHFLTILCTFTFGYLVTMSIQSFYFNGIWKQDYRFWVALAFILILLAYDLSFSWYRSLVHYFSDEFYLLVRRTSKNFSGIVTVVLPIYIFHQVSRSRTRLYGLTTNGFQFKPYFILCLIALAGIALSLANSGLSSYYPTYKAQMSAGFPGNEWIAVLIYETFYAFDFLTVELVFRGFLVIGLSRWLGKESIMPMVTLYCFLHFGKPAAEAISSIFGGFLLGILAYKSKSILGGVMIHICIALGMELFAYLLS